MLKGYKTQQFVSDVCVYMYVLFHMCRAIDFVAVTQERVCVSDSFEMYISLWWSLPSLILIGHLTSVDVKHQESKRWSLITLWSLRDFKI